MTFCNQVTSSSTPQKQTEWVGKRIVKSEYEHKTDQFQSLFCNVHINAVYVSDEFSFNDNQSYERGAKNRNDQNVRKPSPAQ